MLTVLGRNRRSFCDQLPRRDFLRIGTLGLGSWSGLTLPHLLRAESQSGSSSDKSVVMVYLPGGPTQHETKEQAGAEVETTKEKSENVIKEVTVNWLTVILGIALTALSWGTYGSVLHKGQALMQGSRLRPLICVGLAYFVVAVIVPLLLIRSNPLAGMGSAGMLSFMAGTAGAIGAFGIILSFTFGGKPIYIMPLVFGGAPVVNTLVASYGKYDQIGVTFIMSLTVVIVGAVMVLVCQPKPPRKPATPDPVPAPDPTPDRKSDPAVASETPVLGETDEAVEDTTEADD